MSADPIWHPALPADQLWEGELAPVQVGGAQLLLVHLAGGGLRAYQGHCPHQGAPLCEGAFDGRYLTCSAHTWTFDLATGCGVNPAGVLLRRFAVEVRDQQVFVALETRQS
jgi:toluene monooxygenase system ferredoxin subunit